MPTNSLLVQINATVCFIIGWPVNLLLIWLILFRTNQQLLVWSRVLLQSAILDMGLALIAFLNQIEVISQNNQIYGKLNGPLGNSNLIVKNITSYSFMFWHEFSRHAMAVQFGYRWLVICREKNISNKSYFLMLLIPFTMVSIEILFMIFDRMQNCLNCEADGNSFIISYASIFLTFATITTNSIIIFTVLCWLKTRKGLMQQNERSRKINRQVTIVLLLQAVYPIGLAIIPIIITVIFVLLGMPVPEWLSLLVSQVWNTVVYPLIAILIIGHYRRSLLKMIRFKGSIVDTSATTQHVRQANVNQIESSGRPIVS